jgi:CHAP domain
VVRRTLSWTVVLLALAVAPSVRAKDSFPLHGGSAGPRVAAVQWLVSGHRPNVFTKVKPTLKHYTRGVYGARTKAAVKAYKYRIGYPGKGQCGAKASTVTDTAGRLFVEILDGKRQRPICWVAVAAERVKGIVLAGATSAALAIQKLEVSQLGVHEIPDGSNRGPCISTVCRANLAHGPPLEAYQSSTGAFGEAWCASFAQWALHAVTGQYMTAPLPAFVPSIAEWAKQRNYLAAKPRVGSFVVFLSADLQLVNAFHIGYVVRVTATGIQTIEGNAGGPAHFGGAVLEVWRLYALNHMAYINVPGVA